MTLIEGKAGAIVHIGAGECSEIYSYLAAEPQSVTLIEPNPEFHPHLGHLASQNRRVSVLPVAVSMAENTARLYVLNFMNLSSLRRPTVLQDLYPNLTITEEITVHTQSLSTVLDNLTFSENQANWLIIDAPGEEAALLAEIQKDDRTFAFQNIVLKCGRAAYYEDSAAGEEVLKGFQQIGYNMVADVSGEDPDWLAYRLWRNPVQAERMRFEERLKAERTAHMETQTRLKALQQNFTEALNRHSLTQEQKGETEKTLRSLQDSLEQAEQRRAATEVDHIEAQQKLSATQEDLSAAIHANAVAQSDLSDLRKQLSVLRKTNEDQDVLLQKLAQRLGQAADHLHLLEPAKAATKETET